jgi:hypothetical protein
MSPPPFEKHKVRRRPSRAAPPLIIQPPSLKISETPPKQPKQTPPTWPLLARTWPHPTPRPKRSAWEACSAPLHAPRSTVRRRPSPPLPQPPSPARPP